MKTSIVSALVALFSILPLVALTERSEYAYIEEFINSEEMKQLQRTFQMFPEAISQSSLARSQKHDDHQHEERGVEKVSPGINKTQNYCHGDLLYTLISLKKMWAIQMIDSAGKIPSGFTKGELNWPGEFDGCHAISVPHSKIPGIDVSPDGFRGKYCHFNLNLQKSSSSPAISIKVGICIPSSCDEAQIEKDKDTFDKFLDKIPVIRELVKKLPSLSNFTCIPNPDEVNYNDGTVCCIIFIAISCFIVGSATLYDGFIRYYPHLLQKKEPEPSVEDFQATNSLSLQEKSESSYEGIPLVVPPTKKPLVVEIWLAFSAFGNAESILDTKPREGQMNCLHGMRFLSLAWVILGHTYVMCMSAMGNPADLLSSFNNFLFQGIQQAPFSVDTFFLMSGFLLTYLFMKDRSRMTVPKWIYFYAHRFIRLTPVYMIVLFFYATWWTYIGDGPFWAYADRESNLCTKNWWYNLLYINNFVGVNEECMGWAWYLANDMQFYVIAPLFLIPLKSSYRVFGFVAIGALLFMCWLVSGILSNIHSFPIMFNGLGRSTSAIDAQTEIFDEFNIYYIKPWTRIGPYLIGALLGYFALDAKKQKAETNKAVVAMGWGGSIACMIILVYGLYNTNLGVDISAFYNSMARTTWALAVAWVIYACLTNNAGPVDKILSWPVWYPLSRLTYCAYLVHPLIIYWYFGSMRAPYYFTQTASAIHFLGFLMLSYGVAFVVSIFYEGPVIKIEKIIRNH